MTTTSEKRSRPRRACRPGFAYLRKRRAADRTRAEIYAEDFGITPAFYQAMLDDLHRRPVHDGEAVAC